MVGRAVVNSDPVKMPRLRVYPNEPPDTRVLAVPNDLKLRYAEPQAMKRIFVGIFGYEMKTRCIAAGPRVSLAANTIEGNTCSDYALTRQP